MCIRDSADTVYVRAWWSDGASPPPFRSPAVLAPGLAPIARSDVDEPANAPRLTGITALNRPQGEDAFTIEWAESFDAQGRPADYYEVVDQMPIGSPSSPVQWRVLEQVDGLSTEIASPERSTFVRAVWDGGPGPATFAQRYITRAVHASAPLYAPWVTRIRPTQAAAEFQTDRCRYGDYLVRAWMDNAWVEVGRFDAPRNGRCYFDHGITLGVDTAPLQPGTQYAVHFTATDPATGETTYETARNFRTPTGSSETVVWVDYSAAEAALLSRAAQSLGWSEAEFQKNATLLFAYLAAVEGGSPVSLDDPSLADSEQRYASYYSPSEIVHLDNLAVHFGSMNWQQTTKVSTLVLAYLVLTA